MGIKKTNRKKKAEYKRYKKELKSLLNVQKALLISQQVIGAALTSTIASQSRTKCFKCKHSFEENIGGVVIDLTKRDNKLITPLMDEFLSTHFNNSQKK